MTLLSFQPFALISKMVMTAISQNYGTKRKEGNDKFVKMAAYVKVYSIQKQSITVFRNAANLPKTSRNREQEAASHHKVFSVSQNQQFPDGPNLCFITQR